MKKSTLVILAMILCLTLSSGMAFATDEVYVNGHSVSPRGLTCQCGGNMFQSTETILQKPHFKEDIKTVRCKSNSLYWDNIRYFRVYNTWECPECGFLVQRENTGMISTELYCTHK